MFRFVKTKLLIPIVLIGLVVPALAATSASTRFAGSGAVQTDVAQQNSTVSFNTKSYKFHKPSCIWAARCTRNCISISRREAVERGGVACKVCGG